MRMLVLGAGLQGSACAYDLLQNAEVREVRLADLEQKLKTNSKVQADKEIYLHADRDLAYGIVVEVMAAAQRAGINNVGMITDPMTSTRKPK